DLGRLSAAYRIAFQFTTGGEPTIWRDGDQTIVDVLVALQRSGLITTLTMPTNGKVFEDIDFARNLVQSLSRRINGVVVFGVSIAKYQGNLTDEGCLALENLLTVCSEPEMRVVPIALVTLSRSDETSTELSKLHRRVFQRVTPLAPLGRASSMSEDCPQLSLAGNDKTGVGAYLPHFKKDVSGKLGLSDDDFEAIPNAELMNRLSFFNNCGRSFFVKKGWHYCLPFLENGRFEMGRIGGMTPETVAAFFEEAPMLREIREQGVIEAALHRRHELAGEGLERLDAVLNGETAVSVAYRGCMVCKQLAEAGTLH
ncbi:MAG: hypothetical protein HN348_04455, partial [Proteobacteria bacterium]|nr:hypothetical protein [Pseudomonadota bacterium]